MLAIMLMAVCTAKAQLKVDSLGKVGIGVTPATPFKLSVYSAKCGIRGVSTESASDSSAIGVMGAGYIPYHGKAYGLKGMSDSNGVFLDGKSFGVFGYAHGSNSGENYGVFGHVGPHVQGAGVYGSSYFGPDYGIMLQSRYAGYFSGDVMVTSNLTVLGALLYSSDHLYSIGSGDDLLGNDITISKQLQPLSAKRYGYHPFLNTSREMSDYSTSVAEDELSLIEKQAIAKQHYGLDADQLEEVFPDLVYENEDGTKSINYVEMVPILVQAINELKSELDEIKGTGSATKKTATRGTVHADGMGDNVVMLSLSQNKPNPFGTSTSIEVSIPDDVQKAVIYVYDLQGKKIDQVDITARGKQTIQLNAATLSDGMYLYSLIADGKVVETRRMIVE